jgi:hypothetical protein
MARSPEYQAALNAANKVRAALDLPPVKKLYKGVPGEGSACPITATIIDDDLDTERYRVTTSSSVQVVDRTEWVDDSWGIRPKVVFSEKLQLLGGYQALTFIREFDYRKKSSMIVHKDLLPDRVQKNRRAIGRKPVDNPNPVA